MSQVKRSEIFLAAWIAAEKALPPESLRLIQAHDALHAEYRNAAATGPELPPVPESLIDARKRIEADPLASIAFDLRRTTNNEAHKEWPAENPPAEAAR